MVIIKSIIIYEYNILSYYVHTIQHNKNNLLYMRYLLVYLKTFKKRRLFNIIKSNHRNYLYVYALLN